MFVPVKYLLHQYSNHRLYYETSVLLFRSSEPDFGSGYFRVNFPPASFNSNKSKFGMFRIPSSLHIRKVRCSSNTIRLPIHGFSFWLPSTVLSRSIFSMYSKAMRMPRKLPPSSSYLQKLEDTLRPVVSFSKGSHLVMAIYCLEC